MEKLLVKIKKIKINNLVPILGWAPNYNLRVALFGDVIAGFTIAIMQVLLDMVCINISSKFLEEDSNLEVSFQGVNFYSKPY